MWYYSRYLFIYSVQDVRINYTKIVNINYKIINNNSNNIGIYEKYNL